jgi:peptidyl-prolyl cis-trans isomerase A (cyclophilin A)
MKKFFFPVLVFLTVFMFVIAGGNLSTATAEEQPRVVLKTNYGDIAIQLEPNYAPITVQNFLDYVDSDFYDGLIFHRVIPDFMIQGGGFDPNLNLIPPNEPIVNENPNALHNYRGTVAMARTNDPDSATSQFFINHIDNDFLDYTDESSPGYCVFGMVTAGMDVVDAIADVNTMTVEDPPVGYEMADVPVEDVIIYEAVHCSGELAGDINGDCLVNIEDFAQAAGEWTSEWDMSPAGLRPFWKETYNSDANGFDAAADMVLDTNSNLYITGSAANSNGDRDCLTIKYDPNGVELWRAWYDGPAGGFDAAEAIALDSDGNVYIAGHSDDANRDMVTIKYDNEGNEEWVERYAYTSQSYDLAAGIAVSDSNDVCVAGKSSGANGYDIVTVCYDNQGSELWSDRYDGPGNSTDYPAGVQTDSGGNFLVAGTSKGDGTGDDCVMLVYSPGGTRLWEHRYDSGSGGNDTVNDMTVAPDDSMIIAGHSEHGGNYDYMLLRYKTNEELVLESYYDGDGEGFDTIKAVVVDPNQGGIYVTGRSAGVNGDGNICTIKYSSDTNEMLWISKYDRMGSMDIGYDISVRSGFVYVAGTTKNGIGDDDWTVLKYSINGNLYDELHFDGGDDDKPLAAVAGTYGRLYTSGQSYDLSSESNNLMVRAYEYEDVCLKGKAIGELTGDCKVGIDDLELIASIWLESSR